MITKILINQFSEINFKMQRKRFLKYFVRIFLINIYFIFNKKDKYLFLFALGLAGILLNYEKKKEKL